MGKEFN